MSSRAKSRDPIVRVMCNFNMALSCKKIIGLPVYTKSNQHLGRVKNLEIDSVSQAVINYIVNRGFWSEELVINRNQIISLEQDKLVVDDGVIAVPVREKAVATG